MIFYTSDLHIGHKNALRFDNRPFETIDEMERTIIERWNNKVSDSDSVYILGDVFYNYKKDPKTFLKSLKGHLNLITGNHDYGLIMNEDAVSCFESVNNLKQIIDNDRRVVMCHFPIIAWNKSHFGSYHVYGHVHSKIDEDTVYMMKKEKAFNAGCMINNYEPCTLEELEENNRIFREKALTEQLRYE